MLSDLFGMNGETARLRLRKPHLWQLVELQRIADHYKLSSIAVRNAQSSLNSLSVWITGLPAGERNQLLRRFQLDRTVFQNRQRLGWAIEHIWSVRQGLEVSGWKAMTKKPVGLS